MEALKGSYQAPVTLGVLGLVGMAPKAVQTALLDLLAKKATAVMTNVPGPQAPLYMAGGKLTQQLQRRYPSAALDPRDVARRAPGKG